jgi:hypothetical protein
MAMSANHLTVPVGLTSSLEDVRNVIPRFFGEGKMKPSRKKPSLEFDVISKGLRGELTLNEALLEVNLALDYIPLSTSPKDLVELKAELRKSKSPSANFVLTLLELWTLGFIQSERPIRYNGSVTE